MSAMELTVDTSNVAGLLNGILHKLEDPTEILFKLGAYAANEVRRNFTEGGRYQSEFSAVGGDKKWVAHSPVTEKIYESQGIRGPYSLLVQSGRLVQSITSRVEGKSVIVGTNVEYAAIHQFGSAKGAYEMLIKAHIRKRKVMASQILKSGKPGKIKPMNQNTSVRAHMRKSPAIPARPFMNIHPESLSLICAKLTNEFLNGTNSDR